MWDFLDKLAILTGLVAFAGTAYSAFKWWQHQRRQRELEVPVPVRLVSALGGSLLYELPFQPPRRTVTRAEVLGLLGMIPSTEPGRRYEWEWLHQPEFMRDLEEIYQGKRQVLEIHLNEAEFAQVRVGTPALQRP